MDGRAGLCEEVDYVGDFGGGGLHSGCFGGWMMGDGDEGWMGWRLD